MRAQDTDGRPRPPTRCLVCRAPCAPEEFLWRPDWGRYEYRCLLCRRQAAPSGRTEPPFPIVSRRPILDNPHYRWVQTRGHARQRGLPFALSYADFVAAADGPCAYCGEPLPYLSLDLVDNRRGYEMDNVVPCCIVCNR